MTCPYTRVCQKRETREKYGMKPPAECATTTRITWETCEAFVICEGVYGRG